MRRKIGTAIAALAIAGSVAFSAGGGTAPEPAAANAASHVINVGSPAIKFQQWYNGPIGWLYYGEGASVSAHHLIVPYGQCYKIQRAAGYPYSESCNFNSKNGNWIRVTDYQTWRVYRSR